MGNIKIDYKKAKETALKYKEEAEEIYSIKQEMKNIYERLCSEWKDSANVGFKNKFELQLDRLDDFGSFLEDNSSFLDEITDKHNNSEDTFKNNMEKMGVLYEYRD